VEYEIRPREKTETQIGGSWDFKDDVMLNGIVSPDQEAEPCVSDWIFRSAWTSGIRPHCAGREITWTVHAPQNSLVLNAIAWFEGSRKFGSYRSNPPAKAPGALP
jgi:hypothetical protein